MPYYGDYYRGDYYRGDPGIFSGIGKAIGAVAKGAVAVGRAALGLPAAPTTPQIVPMPPMMSNGYTQYGGIKSTGEGYGMVPTFASTLPQVPSSAPGAVKAPGFDAFVSRILPFGETGYIPGQLGGCNVRGHHLNKSGYFTKGGGTSKYPQGVQYHEAKTLCVKNRHMNVTNPKALRRAIRRSRGAVKLLRKAATSIGYSVVTKASLAKRPKARRR